MSTIRQCVKFGLIIGNRGFFPDHLAATGREEMIRVMEDGGDRRGCPDARRNRNSARSKRYEEARRCAELFKKHRGEH